MLLSRINLLCVMVGLLLIVSAIDAKKRKKNKSSSEVARSKTKTKWSSTMQSPEGANPLLATEEHGYYVKRTFVAADGTLRTNVNETSGDLKTVPYLAIPIAWFPCPDGNACRNGYSAIFNTGLNAMSEGFLCDDDCTGPYEPICGKTVTEVAVFYNKCKLNVAKCRTHGYWIDYPLEDCQKAHPKEFEYAAQKFQNSPFFKINKKDTENIATTESAPVKAAELPQIASQATNIGEKLEGLASKIEATKVKTSEVNNINKNH